MTVAKVAIDGATDAFDILYSYTVPEHLSSSAAAGCRVTVPFGRGNTTRQGMIFAITEETSEQNSKNLKEILSVTDKAPVLNGEAIKICEYLHECCFCTYFDAVHTLLPIGLNYKLKSVYSPDDDFSDTDGFSEQETEVFRFIKSRGEVTFEKISAAFENADDILLSLCQAGAILHNTQPIRNAKDMTRKWVRILTDTLPSGVKITERQREIAETVAAAGSVSVKELQYFTGVSMTTISSLADKKIIEIFNKQEFRMPFHAKKGVQKEIVLTDEQDKCYRGLLDDYNSGNAVTSLLYGVTGSGKTQVFLKLVDAVCKTGRGVIIMVPEIALTPQMINIFNERYGEKIAVFHSGLSLGQRMDEYNRIKSGKAQIAIGTRSAVFAPFENLGLVIIDEEQEHTYKSEKSPRFHARDVARLRAKYHNCLLVLSSATPSIETFAAAKGGKYRLYTIKNRYGNSVLPRVCVVDMKKELLSGNTSDISRELAERIDEQLKQKKQVIILLNRRGHNTYVSCGSCGHVFSCEQCSISLTYHSANRRLMCHYCGKSVELPKICPECGQESLSFSGTGTQKLCEQLQLIFKDARILRLDADSTMTKDSYSEHLSAFANGEYDIMVGTQMVAKGLDFPNVTLVGVIGADRAAAGDDYRGFERVFSLLTQVIGRAGRASDTGMAVIQTTEPESQVIALAKEQNYDAFYQTEIANRQLMIFPPFCDLCTVFTQSEDAFVAKNAVFEIFGNIKSLLANEYKQTKLIILGPNPAAVPKVNGRYRYRMLIKCKNTKEFREMLKSAVDIKRVRDLSVGIDINPETVI